MSLKERAAKIDLNGLDEEPDQPQPAGATARGAPVGAPVTGVGSITQRISLHHQVVELQEQLAREQGAARVVKLDPKKIRPSRWKNRSDESYSTEDFAQLKSEIEAAGGNVQPIKVRKLPIGDYEIVYGRRRLRACLELGFEVNAIIEELDDISAFAQMERENRNRADLSPWEQGMMYRDALEQKLFASQRQLAAALNISEANLSKALSLAALPPEVVAAFPSPLDLQHRWAAPLTSALERDTARVMTVAAELAARLPRLPAGEVLQQLLGESETAPEGRSLKVGERVIGSLARDSRGGVTLRIKPGVIGPAQEQKLVELLERLGRRE